MTTAPAEISPAQETAPAQSVGTGLIYTMAFASGAAALMYEVAWAKMLALTFGSTTLAASTVVAAFMGGMGIGAWAYHFVGERFKGQRKGPSPLSLYGYLELGIALSTAVLTMTFYRLPQRFADAAATVDSSMSLAVLRLGFVFALLIVPAALMGATFPALCTVMNRNVNPLDRHLGAIYGINTVGAAMGAVFAGIVMVESAGLTGTVTTANAINLIIGAAALMLAPRSSESSAVAPAADASASHEPPPTVLGRGADRFRIRHAGLRNHVVPRTALPGRQQHLRPHGSSGGVLAGPWNWLAAPAAHHQAWSR